ncbi:MAG: DNA mismatch repair protein MutS [Chloroflexota bacterium]|nr:DNA mismatch repair protein MutS [Chloroflexota bacterium]
MDKVTPLRRQYLDIKGQYPDAIVFFRLGDFYETFDEDAKTTSRELDIVLTSRPVSKGVRVPMAGIPHHAANNYLSRLIDKGYHVAICEQVSDEPEDGLVPRKVVRVVTPGTVIEPDLLQHHHNNYLATAFYQDNRAGVAYVDISTGEFAAVEISGKDIQTQIRSEFFRINPSEILWPESLPQIDGLPGFISAYESWHYELGRCTDNLLEHFSVSTLDGFGLRGKPMAIRTAGAILAYLEDTQRQSIKLLNSVSTYTLNEFMVLDAETRRNLELTETIRGRKTTGSLLAILDHTKTPMGGRLLHKWVSEPLLDVTQIGKRLDAVEFFYTKGLLRAETIDALNSFDDLERLTNRVISGHAIPRDLVAIRENISQLPTLKVIFSNESTELNETLAKIHQCEGQLALLNAAIQDDPPATLAKIGIIRKGFSSELDNVLDSSQHAREWIADLEKKEKERTGIKPLKVSYNKVYGYYIEVTKSNTDLVPEEYIRKQTLVNAERYITPELKEYETLVLNAEEQIHAIESRVFTQVCIELAEGSKYLLETARGLAELDAFVSLAEAAALNGYHRPEVVEEKCLHISNGRHPVVEKLRTSERFVPNDAIMDEDEIIRIITGPNMSGKSTFLRQVALIVLMAQMGSFIPAEKATIGLVDRIFTRIGAQDEIYAGQSTFMVEMIEAANILHHATSRSLLILDEIGRGTSTYDGVSIAWAMVEYIHSHPDLKSYTLFATHYHELTQLAELFPGVQNYNVAVSESDGKVVFMHKIIPGGADRSYGIHVAQIAGIPKPVIQRANEILQQLEKSSGTTLELEKTTKQQLSLFPENNALIEAFDALDINSLTPIEALNLLYEWKRRYFSDD